MSDTKSHINDELDKVLLEGLRYRPPLRGPDGQVIFDKNGEVMYGPPDPRYLGHAIKRMAQLGLSVDPESEKQMLADEIAKVTGTKFKFNGVEVPAVPVVDDELEASA